MKTPRFSLAAAALAAGMGLASAANATNINSCPNGNRANCSNDENVTTIVDQHQGQGQDQHQGQGQDQNQQQKAFGGDATALGGSSNVGIGFNPVIEGDRITNGFSPVVGVEGSRAGAEARIGDVGAVSGPSSADARVGNVEAISGPSTSGADATAETGAIDNTSGATSGSSLDLTQNYEATKRVAASAAAARSYVEAAPRDRCADGTALSFGVGVQTFTFGGSFSVGVDDFEPLGSTEESKACVDMFRTFAVEDRDATFAHEEGMAKIQAAETIGAVAVKGVCKHSLHKCDGYAKQTMEFLFGAPAMD